MVGLGKEAARALAGHTVKSQFQLKVKSGNSKYFYKYPRNWQVWPATLDVCGDPRKGIYSKQKCRHTVVSSALWFCASLKLYLYIKPNVVRSGLDVAVISTSPCSRDNAEICELVDWIPENALDPSTHVVKGKFMEWKDSQITIEIPRNTTEVTAPPTFASLLSKIKGLLEEEIQSLLEFSLSDELDLCGTNGTQQPNGWVLRRHPRCSSLPQNANYLSRRNNTLTVDMDPNVVAHETAAALGGDVEVEYWLAKLAFMGAPLTREFRVPNSERYSLTEAPLIHPLYPRQATAMTQMLEIEKGHVLCQEEERSEIVLPEVGRCLKGKACLTSPLQGGVLGDAIGSEKRW